MGRTISVIIPAHNASPTLQRCLLSIFASSSQPSEVIVVDDASEDETAAIAESFHCQVIRHKKRVGPGLSRNSGAAIAKGEILLFVDADCIVDGGWLGRIAALFKQEGIEAVAGQYKGSVHQAFISQFSFSELKYRERKFTTFMNTVPSCNFACTQEAFIGVGGFSPEHKDSSEDMEFSYRLSRKHRLEWKPEMHVMHHFPRKASTYLYKQYKSSRDDVRVFFRHPRLLWIPTHEDKWNYLEIALVFLVLASLPLVFLSPAFFAAEETLVLFFFFLLNVRFLRFLGKAQGRVFALKSIPLILVRDTVWMFGVLSGLFGLTRAGRA